MLSGCFRGSGFDSHHHCHFCQIRAIERSSVGDRCSRIFGPSQDPANVRTFKGWPDLFLARSSRCSRLVGPPGAFARVLRQSVGMNDGTPVAPLLSVIPSSNSRRRSSPTVHHHNTAVARIGATAPLAAMAIPVRSTVVRAGLGGAIGVSLFGFFLWANAPVSFISLSLVLTTVVVQMVAIPRHQAECPWCKAVVTIAGGRCRCSMCEQRIVVRNGRITRGAFDVIVGRFGPG